MITSICFSCNTGNIIKTNKTVDLKSDLGFNIPTVIYECTDCHQQYVKCSSCDGEGYEESYESQFNCNTCAGHGLIKYNENAE